MCKTGNSIFGMLGDPAANARAFPKAVTGRMRAGLKGCCALAAITFLVTLSAPLSIDFSGNALSWNSAHAGSGDGNYGNGKGNGGANGQNPGKSGQNNGGGGNDDGSNRADPVLGNGPSQGNSPDEAADMAESEFSQSVEAAGGSAAEGPLASTAAVGLPTISQLFSLGDNATVSAEEELRLISNGWNPN